MNSDLIAGFILKDHAEKVTVFLALNDLIEGNTAVEWSSGDCLLITYVKPQGICAVTNVSDRVRAYADKVARIRNPSYKGPP